MPRHPGRVERVDGVSWRGWPALDGGLTTITTYQTGTERRAEGRAEFRPSLLLVGGEVVAMVSRTEQDGVNPSSPGEGVNWLDSERLALTWQSVGRKESEERGTGRRKGEQMRASGRDHGEE